MTNSSKLREIIFKIYLVVKKIAKTLWFEFVHGRFPYSEEYLAEEAWKLAGEFFKLQEKELKERTKKRDHERVV